MITSMDLRMLSRDTIDRCLDGESHPMVIHLFVTVKSFFTVPKARSSFHCLESCSKDDVLVYV